MGYTDEEDGMGFSGLIPSKEEARHDKAVAELRAIKRNLANGDSRSILIDEIVNVIDEGVRKSKFSTYDEWQDAISSIVGRFLVKEKE